MKMVALEKTDLTLPDAAELARGGTVFLTSDDKPMAVINDLTGSDWESVALANQNIRPPVAVDFTALAVIECDDGSRCITRRFISSSGCDPG